MLCPYCESEKIIKAGKNKKNNQRYRCKSCKKYFVETTNNIFYHTCFNKEDFSLILEELLTFTPINFKRTNKTKRKYLNLIFNYLDYYQKHIKLKKKVIVYESNFYFKPTSKKEIRTTLACLISYKNVVLLNLNVSKLSLKSVKLLYPYFRQGYEIIHEEPYMHKELIIDFLLINNQFYDRIWDLEIFDIFKPSKDILKGLKSYLKSVPNLDEKNINNYINLYTYFLQVKGSVKDKINYMINSGNFKKFFENYLKTDLKP